MNLCRDCNNDFSSLAAFDKHRTGTHAYTSTEGLRMEPPREDGRRCLTAFEMREKGLGLDRRGRWCVLAEVGRARVHADAP